MGGESNSHGASCAISQPRYMPWLGYFALIDAVDDFVCLDTVRLEGRTRGAWQTRNCIACRNRPGRWMYLALPVPHKCRMKTLLADVPLCEDGWRERHITALQHEYGRTRYGREVVQLVEGALAEPTEKLGELNTVVIRRLAEYVGIETPIRMASEMPGVEGRSGRLIAICKELGATEYVSGPVTKGYMTADWRLWQESELKVRWLPVFEYQPYPQTVSPFVPGLSIVDALCNVGPAETLKMIRSAGRGK